MLFGVSISVSFCLFLKAIRALQVDPTECRIKSLFNYGFWLSQKHWLSEEENLVNFALLLTKIGIYSLFTHCLHHVLSKTCKSSNPTAQRSGKNLQAKQLRNWNNLEICAELSLLKTPLGKPVSNLKILKYLFLTCCKWKFNTYLKQPFTLESTSIYILKVKNLSQEGLNA